MNNLHEVLNWRNAQCTLYKQGYKTSEINNMQWSKKLRLITLTVTEIHKRNKEKLCLNCINVAFFNHSQPIVLVSSCQFVALDVGAHVPAREIQLHPEAARKSSKYSGALSAEARPGGCWFIVKLYIWVTWWAPQKFLCDTAHNSTVLSRPPQGQCWLCPALFAWQTTAGGRMMNYCYNRLHILPGVNILRGISDVYHISYFHSFYLMIIAISKQSESS